MATKETTLHTQRFKDFVQTYVQTSKFQRHVKLLFALEKLSIKKTNEHFQHFKRMTLRKFNDWFKAGHFILKQLKNRYLQKRNDAFNRLKLNNLKQYYFIEGVKRLDGVISRNKQRNLKHSFHNILLFAHGKNRDLITKEMSIFMGLKRLEGAISKKLLFETNNAFRAIKDDVQKRTQRINRGREILERMLKQRKKTALSKLRHDFLKNKIKSAVHVFQILDGLVRQRKKNVLSVMNSLMQRQIQDLYEKYLTKWQESNLDVQRQSREREDMKRDHFLNQLKNSFLFLDKIFKMHNRKEQRIALGLIQNQRGAQNEVDQTIKNTITLGNLINLLNKRRAEEKLLAFYKWREFARPNGFRYVMEKNVYGENVIRFETFESDKMSLISVQEKKCLAVSLIKNALNKIILRNKAFFMRRFELEVLRINKTKVAQVIALLVQEVFLKRKRLFYRAIKSHAIRVKERMRMPDPSRETILTKIYYRSFYELNKDV